MNFAWKTLLIVGLATFLMGCGNEQVGIRDSGGTITGFYDSASTEACSGGDEVCKTVDCGTEPMEVGQEIDCTVTIKVTASANWTNVQVKDRLGSEWALSSFGDDCDGTEFGTNPSGRQERLDTNIGALGSGAMWTCTFDATTKLNPGGDQSFTSCGYHDFNSGVNT